MFRHRCHGLRTLVPCLLGGFLLTAPASTGCRRLSPEAQRDERQQAVREERLQQSRHSGRPAPGIKPQVLYVPAANANVPAANANVPAANANVPAANANVPAMDASVTAVDASVTAVDTSVAATTAPPSAGITASPGSLPDTPEARLPARSSLLHPSLERGHERAVPGGVQVSYESWALGLHAYFRRVLAQGGWKKVGELLPGEHTKCGGDFGGYYQKGAARLRFHLCGSEGVFGFERGQLRQLRTLLGVSFTTYGYHPRQILGRGYLERPSPRRVRR